MPSWTALVNALNDQSDLEKGAFLNDTLMASLRDVSALRTNRNTLFYASGFLQKPGVPGAQLMITHEDLNGLMSVIHGMDCSKGLTLMLHTPGGVTNAAETIVAYLRSKFETFEVLVPTLAMSAGTMIALASNNIIMGRQSQLGPIDPQMGVGGGRTVSARSVVEQFDRAKAEVLSDQATAHVWAPIVQSLGPALLQEAQNALDYSETMVARWLETGMCSEADDPRTTGEAVAHHFNDASTHKSHGRRIDRDEARAQGVKVEDLEDDQALQEAALTAYHLATIMFDKGPATKFMATNNAQVWIKNWGNPEAVPVTP